MSDQRKPTFQWAKGKDLIHFFEPVLTNGEMRALTGGQIFEPLPRPSVKVRKAIATFPILTAVGRDEWEPWTWRHLSDGAIEALTDIMAMENMMVHPRQCKLNIVKLLPKPTGGYRTIGILPTLLRVWCRTRREFNRCWQLSNARFLFLG